MRPGGPVPEVARVLVLIAFLAHPHGCSGLSPSGDAFDLMCPAHLANVGAHSNAPSPPLLRDDRRRVSGRDWEREGNLPLALFSFSSPTDPSPSSCGFWSSSFSSIGSLQSDNTTTWRRDDLPVRPSGVPTMRVSRPQPPRHPRRPPVPPTRPSHTSLPPQHLEKAVDELSPTIRDRVPQNDEEIAVAMATSRPRRGFRRGESGDKREQDEAEEGKHRPAFPSYLPSDAV
ncbi:hypothetical protein GGF50DRAFT_121711 [Schizophyllum commune]